MRIRRIQSQPTQAKFDPSLIIYASATRLIQTFLNDNQMEKTAFQLTTKVNSSSLAITVQTSDPYTAMVLRMEQIPLTENLTKELQSLGVKQTPQLKIVIRPIAAQDVKDLPNQPVV